MDHEGEVIAGPVVSHVALGLVVIDMVDHGAEEGVFFGGGGRDVVGAEDGADLGEDRGDGIRFGGASRAARAD